MDVLVNYMGGILSQCITHISVLNKVHFIYLQILFSNYTSKKEKEINSGLSEEKKNNLNNYNI